MFCTRCGTKIPDGQNQCPNCQTPAYQYRPMPYAPQVQPQAQPHENPQVQPQVNPQVQQPWAQPQMRPQVQQPYGQPQMRPQAQQPYGQPQVRPQVQPQAQPWTQPQVQSQVRPQVQPQPQPNFQLNDPAVPQKPKKKAKNLTWLLIGAGALVALIAVAIIIFGGVFASPQDKLMKMEKTAATVASNAIAGVYGDYVDSLKDEVEKLENGTGSEMQVKLTADKTMLNSLVSAMLYEYTYGYGDMSSLDMSWLDNVILNVDMDVKGSATGMKIGIGVNDKVLANVVAQMDLDKNKIYLGLPELNPTYLYTDFDAMNVDMSTAGMNIEAMKDLIAALPAEKDVQKMLQPYLQIIAAYADEVIEDKQTVHVADQSKEMKVLNAKISEKKLKQMILDICNIAVEDETLESFVNAFADYTNTVEAITYAQYGMFYTPVDVYTDLKQELLNTIEYLQEDIENSNEDNYLVLSNYIAGGAVVGRKLQVFSEGVAEFVPSYYMFIPTSNGGVFEVMLPEDGILGDLFDCDCVLSGKIDGKEMSVDLILDGQNAMNLKTKDLTVKDGVMNGEIRLAPGSSLMAEMGMSLPATLQDMYLQVNCEGKKNDGSTEVQLVVGGKTMLGVTVSGKETKYDSFQEPTYAMDMMAEDSYVWATSLRLDPLIENMRAANIPSTYIQVVEQLEMMLALQ